MSMIDVSSSGLVNRPRGMKRHTGAPAQESRRRRAALRRLFVRWRSARTGCPAGSEGGELEAGVERGGRVGEALSGVLAETLDPLPDVRGEGGDRRGGHLPALAEELTQEGGHVQRGVEDHAASHDCLTTSALVPAQDPLTCRTGSLSSPRRVGRWRCVGALEGWGRVCAGARAYFGPRPGLVPGR